MLLDRMAWFQSISCFSCPEIFLCITVHMHIDDLANAWIEENEKEIQEQEDFKHMNEF